MFLDTGGRLYRVFSPSVWNDRFRMAVTIGLSSLHYFALMFFKKRPRLGWSVCDDFNSTDLILAHVVRHHALSNLNEKRKSVCIYNTRSYYSTIYVLVFSTHV